MSTAARSSSSLRGDDGMSETKGNDVASVSSLSCDLRSVCVFLQSKLEYIAKMLLTSILSLLGTLLQQGAVLLPSSRTTALLVYTCVHTLLSSFYY